MTSLANPRDAVTRVAGLAARARSAIGPPSGAAQARPQAAAAGSAGKAAGNLLNCHRNPPHVSGRVWMSAALLVVSVGLLGEGALWMLLAAGSRVGWRAAAGYALWLPSFGLACMPLWQLWLYRWMTGTNPLEDNIIFTALMVEGVISLVMILYYAPRNGSKRKRNQQ